MRKLHIYIKSSRQSINTEKVFRADIVFIHKVGSNFHGTVIKDRANILGRETYCHIDQLAGAYAKGLPRKRKKRITKQVTSVVKEYKRNF